jgi:thiol:disulfide interchange protein DsbA
MRNTPIESEFGARRLGTSILLTTLVLVACSGNDAPSAPPSSAQTEGSAPAAEPSQPTASAPVSQPQASTTAVRPASNEPSGERRFNEGAHYVLLTPQQPTSTDGDLIEVAEVFMYSCPGCFAFEPYIEQWTQGKADYVNFVRIPAAWNTVAEVHARAFYTAEVLGKLEEMHTPFFREFHINGNYLDTESKLIEFFARFGVDENTFSSTFDSFAVHTKLQRAKDLIARYRVSETPNVVVNGRYLTRGSLAQSYQNWFDILDELVAVEWASE